MASKKTRSKSISLRPNLTVYEAIDPGLYHTLVSLPEDVRSEFIMGVLKRAALGYGTLMSAPHGQERQLFPVATEEQEQVPADAPSKAPHPPTPVQTARAVTPGTPRGLESLGFGSLSDLGDAFVYDQSTRQGS